MSQTTAPTAAQEDVLHVSDDGSVLRATLQRPTKGNALNQPLIDAIDALCLALERLYAQGQMRTVVLTGAGEKAFCAGADITELDGISPQRAIAQMRRGQQVFDRLERLPFAVIAAINGFALGGGLELAMATDIRIAATRARLGQPEITLGNVPGWGGTQRLPRLVGRGRATEMILSGETIDAARAEQIGLVNSVAGDAVAAAHDLAGRISQHNPVAVAGAKRAIRTGLEIGTAEGLLVEAAAVADCCATEFQRAAVQTFLNRKKTPD